MQCKGCGAELHAGIRYCPYCGRELPQEPPRGNGQGVPEIHIHTHYDGPQPVQYGPPVSPKRRLVALLLEIFLGWLGIHRFYMGHAGLGVLFLLTGGFCGVGCLVDFLILLLGTPRDGFGREIKW